MSERWRVGLICIGLALTTLLTYAPGLPNDFVNYDDPEYVTDNAVVKRGLTIDGFRWAFFDSLGYASNWHPLTWLSHMLDCQVFGLRPSLHHLTSILLHAASVVLLYLALQRMTGCDWKSAFVAGVFALHPLHVQSVAWVAERKDVLAAMFWMLTMWCYARYAEQPTVGRYLQVALALMLGLLSKPMLVTLPFVLLLLDSWPLHREQTIRRLIVEKLPLIVLCIAASALTFAAQSKAGAVLSEAALPLSDRAGNAIVSYARYAGRFFWPSGLAVFYPYEHWGIGAVIASAALLLAISLVAIAMYRRAPYVVVGWLWLIVTFLPVIGLIQIGRQSMADRYMHIPMIGLAIIIAWGVPDLLRPAVPRTVLLAMGAIALALCSWRSVIEIGYWKNSLTLFRRALEVAPDNPLAHNNLGTALATTGNLPAAIEHFRAALHSAPNDPAAHRNLANAMIRLNDIDGAIFHLRESIRLTEAAGKQSGDHVLLAKMLGSRGRFTEAAQHLEVMVARDPGNIEAKELLADARARLAAPQSKPK